MRLFGSMISEQNIFRIISDLFLAGSETTSVSLDWAMMYMTEFPDTQKKCQDEIEKVSLFFFTKLIKKFGSINI